MKIHTDNNQPVMNFNDTLNYINFIEKVRKNQTLNVYNVSRIH